MKKTVEILERIKEHFMVGSNAELSEKWGIPTGTLDTWKNKDAIPNAKLIKLAKEEKLSLDWIKTGEGSKYQAEPLPEPMFLSPEISKQLASLVAEAMPTYGKDKRTTKLCTAFDALGDKDKDEVLKEIMPYIIKRF